MTGKEFVASLVVEMDALFARLGEREILESETAGRVEIVPLLKLALRSELEASELAGYWMTSTPGIDAKRLLALQCGDEMRHYHLIAERLQQLGEAMDEFDPLEDGYSPLYQYMKGLRTTVERVAAGPFASEAIARVRNVQFIAFCESVGDRTTAKLYREVIQPEEVHHHELGQRFLEVHCSDQETQTAAKAAVHTTLAIADELQSLAEKQTGMHPLPVS